MFGEQMNDMFGIKKIGTLIFIATVVCIFNSCTKDTDTSTSTTGTTGGSSSGITFSSIGTLTLKVNHVYESSALELSPKAYITSAKDTIKLTQLSYYITNVTLTSANGSKVKLPSYHLIDFVSGQANQIVLNNIPAGNYTAISYLIGVDSIANSTGVHSGDLDPSNGMYWTWNTGYVFFRLKGFFSAQEEGLSFDIGGDDNLMTTSHSLTNYNVSGGAITITMNMNISKVFNSPNVYDLKIDATTIHTAGTTAIAKLIPNIQGAFSVTGVQ